MNDNFEIGVVVGRFQLPLLHTGHKTLLDTVSNTHKHLLICVGTTTALVTRKDPLDFPVRQGMLQEAYPGAIVVPISDCGSDQQWSDNLDGIIRGIYPTQSVRLYGGKSSFIDHYCGSYPTMLVYPLHGEFSATEIRKNVDVSPNTLDFRRGIIYAANHQYPKIWMCADIALVKGGVVPEIILGKKTVDGPLVFPGGFVSPEDDSLAMAARRELFEETGIPCNVEPRYIGSYIIDDSRYDGDKEKLMTAFFYIQHTFGQIESTDDLLDPHWCPMTNKLKAYIAPWHRILYEALEKYLVDNKEADHVRG